MAALALVAGTGCATFIRGNTTTVTVRSDAPGAEVVVDGEPRGVTPFAMALDHTVDHDVGTRSADPVADALAALWFARARTIAPARAA